MSIKSWKNEKIKFRLGSYFSLHLLWPFLAFSTDLRPARALLSQRNVFKNIFKNQKMRQILVKMNIFLIKSSQIRVESIDFLEIASSLRGRSSTMALSISMFWHAITTYSRSFRDSRGPYSARNSACNSKSREKVHFKRFCPIPRCAPA